MPPARPTPSPITDPLPDERQTTITVLPWRDPLVETHPESHPTATNETLVWWTPMLGPTATLMAHRLAGYLVHNEQVQFTLGDLARTFGMGQSLTRVRTGLARLERFGITRSHGDTVYLRTALPPLTRRQIDQLPPYLADLYRQRRTNATTTSQR